MLVVHLSAVLFICEGRVGLCCVFAVFPGCTTLVRIINRDIDACKWGGGGGGLGGRMQGHDDS